MQTSDQFSAADAPREQLQRLGLVPVLAPLVLDGHHGVRGEVRRAHGGVRRINMLAAGAGRAKRVDADVVLVQRELDLVDTG